MLVLKTSSVGGQVLEPHPPAQRVVGAKTHRDPFPVGSREAVSRNGRRSELPRRLKDW